jgi:hypothetical protein
MSTERIARELEILGRGAQIAELVTANGRQFVLYKDVPTSGGRLGLPESSDVIVPVPPGYPASPIDLAGLPTGSPLLMRVKGGQNNQGIIQIGTRQWQLASYHPHNNGGGPPWDQNKHGFHTYVDQLIAWLDKLT